MVARRSYTTICQATRPPRLALDMITHGCNDVTDTRVPAGRTAVQQAVQQARLTPAPGRAA